MLDIRRTVQTMDTSTMDTSGHIQILDYSSRDRLLESSRMSGVSDNENHKKSPEYSGDFLWYGNYGKVDHAIIFLQIPIFSRASFP